MKLLLASILGLLTLSNVIAFFFMDDCEWADDCEFLKDRDV